MIVMVTPLMNVEYVVVLDLFMSVVARIYLKEHAIAMEILLMNVVYVEGMVLMQMEMVFVMM